MQQADALVTMAKCYLTGQRESSSASSDNYQVTVHVDRTALSDDNGRSGLPIESVRRLCCDGDTCLIVEDENGEPLNIGRRPARCPEQSNVPSGRGTRAACSPAVRTNVSSMPTISSTGRQGVRPVSAICCCCARAIIGWYTRADSLLRKITWVAGISGGPAE